MKTIILFSFLLLSLNAFSDELYKAKENPQNKVVSLISKAAKQDNQTLMLKYFEYGGNPNIQDSKGYTPLIYAAYYGHKKMVHLLLRNGANACLKDKRGNTALMGAIFKGNLSIAYTLMKTDCDVDQKNKANQTALMYASLFGRKEIAKKLIAKGAKKETKDINGENAISIAKKQFNQDMLNMLENSL